MGNKPSQVLPLEIYETNLKSLNESTRAKKEANCIDFLSYPTDIVKVLISYCERLEQYRLINIMFTNLKLHQNVLPTILDKTINIIPKIDPYLITAFNKKNNVLSGIKSTMEYKFYFTNIHIKGSNENITHLKSNKNNIIYAFIYYVTVMKDMINKDKTNHILEVDKFIDSYKKNKQYNNMEFNTDDIFCTEDEKLANIKYKNAYKFAKYERISLKTIPNITNLSWKEYNDLFLKYIITNQLNFCCDNKKLYNQNINEYINLLTDDTFNMFCGCSLYCDPLIGYSLNSQSSKYTHFSGQTSFQTYKKETKVYITTTKMSSIFLINNMSNEINVFTMLNRSSDDHLKEKIKYAKKILNAYVDQVHKSGF